MTITIETGAEDVAWDLTDAYAGPDDARLEADLEDARTAAAAFAERYRGRFGELEPTELLDAVQEVERINGTIVRARAFAYVLFATATSEPERGALLQRINEEAAALETQLVFVRLEWAALDDARVEELLADDALAEYRHFLSSLRRFRPHLLSEPEERILTEKSVSGTSAWGRLFQELLAGLRVRLDGSEASLEEAIARLHSPDRPERGVTATAITEALATGIRTRAFIFNTLLLDKATDDRLRGYPHWLAARNLANQAPDESVDALITATVARYDIPQRYYRLKARLLGLPRLAFYDRFAPVSSESTFTRWDEAVDLVVNAYADFSTEAGEIVARFFDERWVDAPVRPDKMIGAFCMTRFPGVHPYVLLNYTGDRRSVLTLAHELGHGLHGVLAQPRGVFNSETPLTLSETASVFGEALTFKRLLGEETDPARRLDLLTGRLDDAVATVFRQIAMNRFEHAVHTARRSEGELSVDRISEIWLQTQGDLMGDSVDLDGGYENWWSYVPHYVVSPGYVYAYSFGFLFSLAIFRRYERDGDVIVEPYLELLRAGGSRKPTELAALVGLDIADPAIWSTALEAVDDDLREAEALAARLS